MNRLVVKLLLLVAFGTALPACESREKPAVDAQRRQLNGIVATAAAYLQTSEKFDTLESAVLPSVDSTADYYVIDRREIRLVSDSIIASVRNDSAEILITFGIASDVSPPASRQGLVRLVRENGEWQGVGTYLLPYR